MDDMSTKQMQDAGLVAGNSNLGVCGLCGHDGQKLEAELKRLREESDGDSLSTFDWLDEAKFVGDGEGGHIEFAGKIFRVAELAPDGGA